MTILINEDILLDMYQHIAKHERYSWSSLSGYLREGEMINYKISDELGKQLIDVEYKNRIKFIENIRNNELIWKS